MKSYLFTVKLILVILMLAFIWCHSMMPGSLSSMESEWFLTLVRPLVSVLERLFSRFGMEMDPSYLVRKLAHFSEYAVLGMLVYLLFLKPGGRGKIVLSAAVCLAAAAVDEGIQILAAGRGPALKDVGIDFGGSCAGMLVAALVVFLFYRIRRRKTT